LNYLSFLSPKPTLSDSEIASGLKWMTLEGIASMGFGSVTTSGFLAAYALLLGASNFQIGILASIPFIAQLLQIPVIALVEKIGNRKIIALMSWIPAQLLWIPMALIPFFFSAPSDAAIWALLGLMILRSVLNAITSCSWNSWVRDIVPQHTMGAFFARRLMLGSVVAMGFGFGAALFVDRWGDSRPMIEDQLIGYTIVLFIGAVTLGLFSPFSMALMPEPLMQKPGGVSRSLITALKIPIKDRNFVHILKFHFAWGLALNLATPFFAVYMLNRLGLPLSAVIGFSILAQATNVLFLRVWGPMVDRVGAKVILQLSASLYLLVVAGWIFTTLPERHFLTIPLLILLHMLAGVAAAGVNASSGVIAMRIAPPGDATAYLAVNSLAANLGAGIGPLLGGTFAVVFASNMLDFNIAWTASSGSTSFPAFSLAGFDFLFGIAFILGLLSLTLLGPLREEGEESREVVLESLLAPMRRMTQPMSTVPGLGIVGHFPYSALLRTPIPGLDVAFGVTAFQFAETARSARIAVGHGTETLSHVSEIISDAANRLWKPGSFRKENSRELAAQTARGLIHAHASLESPDLLVPGEAIEQTVAGLHRAGIGEHEELVLGAAEGAIRGAIETGADIRTAISGAIAGVANSSTARNGFTDRIFDDATDAMMGIVIQSDPAQQQEALDEIQNYQS
jgi:MFS family permease